MATKTVEIEGIGPVTLVKRTTSRSIRITITHGGEVRVSLPSWAPYASAIAFAKTKAAWIAEQKPDVVLVEQGSQVGKAHHIHFEAGSGANVSTRVTGNQARVLLPVGVRWDNPDAQEAAHKVAIKVLKKEASHLLPNRLKTLADQFGYTYKSVSIKRLTGRWGSCSEHKDIILNCYLMQLPWELIDYVLLHELAHTRVMAHGQPFWEEMAKYSPNLVRLRREIKAHKPTL